MLSSPMPPVLGDKSGHGQNRSTEHKLPGAKGRAAPLTSQIAPRVKYSRSASVSEEGLSNLDGLEFQGQVHLLGKSCLWTRVVRTALLLWLLTH